MSASLRDQLLKAGLINKKQANEAERQQQRHERHPSDKRGRATAAEKAVPPRAPDGKAARDQVLNRQQHDKAEKKARLAQIKQLIEQNRLSTVDGDEFYNFVDGNKVRRIAVNAAVRARLTRSEIAIVRHEGRYDLVPMPTATRIRERDERAFVTTGGGKETSSVDEEYPGFSVPDDLMW